MPELEAQRLGSEALRLARRHVPGRDEPRLELVGTGLARATFRVERDGKRYAMRLERSAVRGGAHARWEAELRAHAARAGFAPTPLLYAAEDGVLVSTWVEGREFEAAAVGEPRGIDAVAALMRRIHGLQVPPAPQQTGPGPWIESYERALRAASPDRLHATSALRAASLRELERLAAAHGGRRTLCHSDLHPANLVETDGGLVVLDWEYAHIGDPLWDVAGWCCMNDFDFARRATLLARYLGRLPEVDERQRFEALIWLYDYVCLLWSEVFLLETGGAADPAIRERADRLAERLATGGSAARVPAH
ncbi:MAG: phosphotransferase [Gammaproteobacteria bacterium]|nr:phosphotransferase [Gammaproteobacteria bacterium]